MRSAAAAMGVGVWVLRQVEVDNVPDLSVHACIQKVVLLRVHEHWLASSARNTREARQGLLTIEAVWTAHPRNVEPPRCHVCCHQHSPLVPLEPIHGPQPRPLLQSLKLKCTK